VNIHKFSLRGGEFTIEQLSVDYHVGSRVYLRVSPPHFEKGGFIQNYSKEEWAEVVEHVKELARNHPQIPANGSIHGSIHDFWSQNGLVCFDIKVK
jgi:hypothetical protein